MTGGPLLPVLQPGRRPHRPSVFDRLAVVGLGPAGAAVALAARHAFPSALVIGVDRNDRLETCVRLGAIDVGADDPIVIADAELVVLAVPRAEQDQWIARLPELVPGQAIITTLRGDEGVPDAAAVLPARFRFIAGHLCLAVCDADPRPLSAEGMAGAAWALIARDGDPDASKLAGFVSGLGARPVLVDGEDDLRAFLQQRDQALGAVADQT
jgi:prephenate dehydrogenase